jgi:hypothetical protein
MDAGIADTINRHVVQLITQHLDSNRQLAGALVAPGRKAASRTTLMGERLPPRRCRRAWFVGFLAARTPDLDFDFPADCDWENLFSHFRAEILARRDPKTPPVHAAQTPVRDGVGSR